MPGTKTRQPPIIVVSASAMDTMTFARHFTARHKGSLAGQETLPDDVTFEVEQMYRAFHFRLHTLHKYKHEHEPEDEADAVDHAIECLIENGNWGWKELAGIDGHVAVFPDGKIATRINGAVKHHDTIENATDRLIS